MAQSVERLTSAQVTISQLVSSSPASGSVLTCLLYTSDAADDTPCVDLGGRRIIKKKILSMASNDLFKDHFSGYLGGSVS